MEADATNSSSDNEVPQRQSKILLEDDAPIDHPLSETTAAPASNSESISLQRLPRVELSPAIASMLAAMSQERKPTLYWDKLKVCL